jgi:hypothetical protein
LSDEIDESKTEDKRVARAEKFSLRAVRELQGGAPSIRSVGKPPSQARVATS